MHCQPVDFAGGEGLASHRVHLVPGSVVESTSDCPDHLAHQQPELVGAAINAPYEPMLIEQDVARQAQFRAGRREPEGIVQIRILFPD